MTQGISIEHMKERRCKKVWKAKRAARVCQYLESNPVPYQCKVISAYSVQTDAYKKVSHHQGVKTEVSHDGSKLRAAPDLQKLM